MDLLRLLNHGGVNGGVNGSVNLEVLIFETIQNSPGINAPAIADQIKKSLRTTQQITDYLTYEYQTIHTILQRQQSPCCLG